MRETRRELFLRQAFIGIIAMVSLPLSTGEGRSPRSWRPFRGFGIVRRMKRVTRELTEEAHLPTLDCHCTRRRRVLVR